MFEHVEEESRQSEQSDLRTQHPFKYEASHTEMSLAYAYTKPLSYTVWFVSDGEVRRPVYLDDIQKTVNELRADLLDQLKGIYI